MVGRYIRHSKAKEELTLYFLQYIFGLKSWGVPRGSGGSCQEHLEVG